MLQQKLLTVLLLISAVAFAGFISSAPNKGKNLKVLPKDISEEKLDSIMQSYNKALGVSCEFCHATDKKGDPDFPSDDNPVKEVARTMMKMTIDINREYFNTDKTIHPAYLNTVKCYTCHKGDAYPQ